MGVPHLILEGKKIYKTNNTALFKSKLTIGSQSSQDSRIETRFSIVASQFSILDSCKLIKPEWPLFSFK